MSVSALPRPMYVDYIEFGYGSLVATFWGKTVLPQFTIMLSAYLVYMWVKADRSKAEVLLCFSVACFWCQRFGEVSPYVCSYYVFFRFAEWPPLGNSCSLG